MTCAADLYRPDGPAGSLPCLVMGHGFSGTKGLARVYAERFAAAGLAVLVFDYRHFGASGGRARPRRRGPATGGLSRRGPLDPVLSGHRSGADRALGNFLQRRPRDRRRGEDPRIAAVVAQVPCSTRGGQAARRGSASARAEPQCAQALRGCQARRRRAVVAALPARGVGRPGEAAVYTDPQVAAIFAELGGPAAGATRLPARFLFGLPRYRPGTAERLQMPLLVCVADRDLEASPSFAAWVAQAPRGQVRHYPVGHFDVYVEPVRTLMITDQIAFLRAMYLGSSALMLRHTF